MLSHFKKFVKKNEADIVLVIGVILVALISFGAGRLTAPQITKDPIIIQEPTASIIESLGHSQEMIGERTKKGRFVGSINSNIYHWPECPFAQRISSANQIWFESEEKAKKTGYKPCGNFQKFTPLDHRP
jgi:uncharacterized SAM-binding protein YcdF (DUF218 family)